MSFVIATDERRGSAVDRFGEADHRVANQLTVTVDVLRGHLARLRKGAEVLDRDVVCEILQDAVGKVIGIAHLHRVLAQHGSAEEVELGDLLVSIIREIAASLSLGERLRITQELKSGCVVSKDTAQKVALIVVEIVMNAVKYAHPTGIPAELHIACAPADHGILLELADDGVGLPEEFDPAHDGGVGFQLIRSVAEQLGANLAIESDQLGLSFRLKIRQDYVTASG